jgi:N-acetylglucosaminyldiphosphoundecaprenol N-acetyl-beta-D-mannosaminyltransferase
VMFRVLPIALGLWFRGSNGRLVLTLQKQKDALVVSISGHATKAHAGEAIACFRGALAESRNIVIDLSETEIIDARFFGLLLMLRKGLVSSGRDLIFRGMSKSITRMFYLHGFDFLLKPRAVNG